MKPDWKDAPEWANYLAKDSNGVWYWYALKPKLGAHSWIASANFALAGNEGSWAETLEKRS